MAWTDEDEEMYWSVMSSIDLAEHERACSQEDHESWQKERAWLSTIKKRMSCIQ